MDGGDDVGFDYLSYEKARSGIELDQAAGTVTGEHPAATRSPGSAPSSVRASTTS